MAGRTDRAVRARRAELEEAAAACEAGRRAVAGEEAAEATRLWLWADKRRVALEKTVLARQWVELQAASMQPPLVAAYARDAATPAAEGTAGGGGGAQQQQATGSKQRLPSGRGVSLSSSGRPHKKRHPQKQTSLQKLSPRPSSSASLLSAVTVAAAAAQAAATPPPPPPPQGAAAAVAASVVTAVPAAGGLRVKGTSLPDTMCASTALVKPVAAAFAADMQLTHPTVAAAPHHHHHHHSLLLCGWNAGLEPSVRPNTASAFLLGSGGMCAAGGGGSGAGGAGGSGGYGGGCGSSSSSSRAKLAGFSRRLTSLRREGSRQGHVEAFCPVVTKSLPPRPFTAVLASAAALPLQGAGASTHHVPPLPPRGLQGRRGVLG